LFNFGKFVKIREFFWLR